MPSDLFPYEPRPNQRVILDNVNKILSSNGNIVIESGTGSGKTICALSPCLEYALENGKKVVYLTRTNSQQNQVFKELRQIKQKEPSILGIGMQGRQNLCTLFTQDRVLGGGTSEELSKLCGDRKKAVIEGDLKKGCRYYENLIKYDMESIISYVRDSTPALEEFKIHCQDLNVCPYEAIKQVMREARVVSAPYIFFFSPMIRRTFLNWLNVAEDDVIVIIDEAHNLPEFARELLSTDLSVVSIQLAITEAKKIGDPILFEGKHITGFLGKLMDIMLGMVEEYVIDDDGLVPPTELEMQLMSAFKMTTNEVNNVILDLLTHGEIIRERKRMNGKLPRSYIHAVGLFLRNWTNLDNEDSTKLAIGGEPCLETYGLDPSRITKVINECHSSIHLSGTLSPLDEYRDSIGLLPDTHLLSLPGPFPVENRSIMYMEEFSTKYEEYNSSENMKLALRDILGSVIDEVNRNTLIFFPSYAMLNTFKELLDIQGRPFYCESGKMSQKKLMNTVMDFKADTNALMLAVMGGRVSEGIDFPGKELELVILVGIPYPKPTAKHRSLFEYYERNYGRGWEYTVLAPATRKLLQSIGRLIRTEKDRGVALILDRRIKNFKANLPGLKETADPVIEIRAFFKDE